jgi:glycerate 2-kinase
VNVAGTDPRRQLLLELLRAGLAAVDGRRRTAETLKSLLTEGIPPGPCQVAAVGKAACAMALGAHDALGDRLQRTLIIAKDGHLDAGVTALPGLEVIESSHPMPDQRSLDAGQRLWEFVAQLPEPAVPVFLVSGGASSLAEVLVPGASLQDLRQLNAAGLASGEDIAKFNARRRRLSRLKGGGLTACLKGRAALALFVSDVPGDDPAVIGSGLLGPAPRGAPPDRVTRRIIARIEDAMQAVARRAVELRSWMSEARFTGDADRLAVRLTHELYLSGAEICIWGGESVVRLPAHPGQGGRNQHLALAAARLIAGQEDLLFLAAGTDGTDGPTDDAGALVDGETCARATVAGLDVDHSLSAADSQSALAAAGDLIHTGPTGTNVGDLVVGLKLSSARARSWCERNGVHAPMR